MSNIVDLADFRERKKQQDLDKLAAQLKVIINSLKQDAIQNIDKVLADLSDRHKDLYRICNYKYDSKYPLDQVWKSQEIPLHTGIMTINIPKQTYDEYKFLKNLVYEIAKKYDF